MNNNKQNNFLGCNLHKTIFRKNGPVSGTYYRFHIYGDKLNEIPVLLDRKKCKTRSSKKNASMTGIKLRSVGRHKCYSLQIDGDGHILLDDFTVVSVN